MKFTKEQKDYLKHCGEHFEVLIGGRGHSKTKEVIEDMQKEIERLNNIIDELEKYLNEELENYTIEIKNKNKGKLGYTLPIKGEIKNILDKLIELKGDNK